MLRIDRDAIGRLPVEQREEARRLLAVYEERVRANPLLAYTPHPKQVVFHGSHEPLKAFLGGNRSGKTTAGICDDLIQAVDRDCLPESLVGFKKWEAPFFCRIIVPDFTSTLEGVIFQKLREWAPRAQLVGGGFDKAYDKARRRLNFENGSWFDFLTFEQDLDKFGGAALHRVHYDEEPPGPIRRESSMRLIDYGGDELFTMTPLQGMSWMYDEIWEPWTKGRLDEATVVLVDMDDNPHLDERTKRRALAGLSHEERQARKSGRFVHFAGMIYDEFSRNEHVTPEISELPRDVKVLVGIDPGMRHMAAVVWVYLTPDDRMVVFDELALQGHTVGQVAQAIHLRNQRWGREVNERILPLRPEWYVIDPAARNVVHQTGRSDQMEFTDHGIVTILGQNSVTAGINRVKERLQSHRLVVTANCQTLIDQFRKYRWASASRSESDPKEKPVKSDDHCLVAGTLVATEDGPKAIEDVRIGDRVWTRGGLCPVVAAGPTRVAPTRRLTCSDGSQVVGTDDHPIPVERDGQMLVTRMDAVRYGDILLSCRRSSSSKGSASDATPTPRTAPAASTSPPDRPTSSEASRRCTARSSRRTTAPSPTDGTSTTPTGTRSTTTPPTSSACRHESTSASTGHPSERRQPASTPPASGPRPRTGTPASKDAPGTQSTAEPPGTASRSRPSVSTAAPSTSPGSPSASAPTTASPRPGEPPAPTTSTEPARHAGQSFASTAIPGLPTARVSALGTHVGPEAQTYNLTVYGHSEFFAGGVLVLNCLDALRYVVMSRPAVPDAGDETDGLLPPLERAARRHQRGRRRREIPGTPMGGIFA